MDELLYELRDGVARGVREDRSGVALEEQLTAAGWTVVERRVVEDGVERACPRR